MRKPPALLVGLLLTTSGCVSMPLSPAEAVSASLAPPVRPELSLQREAPGKPPVALNLAALGAGGTGGDLIEYNEILSQLAGPKAEVRLVDPPRHEGSPKDELDAHRAADRLGNLRYQPAPPDSMKLGTASLDAALMVMPYSGLFDSGPGKGKPANDSGQFIEQIVTALKPGAVLLVIDQKPTADPAKKDDAGKATGLEKPSKTDLFQAHGLDFIGTVPAATTPEAAAANKTLDPAASDKPDRVIEFYRKP